jgi:phosphopantothenoylcysteine decarboxylase/phosphopantothenate--cysteine ligase
MITIVTIGPTQEPLDAMRILSNRSTGELGTMLALSLVQSGHHVIALRSTGATADSSELHQRDVRIIPFTTTEDLRQVLIQVALDSEVNAIFHAAAVSDFFLPDSGTGKIPSHSGSINLTLHPTPKLLPLLRGWFPCAWITGWKFEASGGRDQALAAASTQISSCGTDACVLNGPSYGEGFGHLSKEGAFQNLPDRTSLCEFLTTQLGKHSLP